MADMMGDFLDGPTAILSELVQGVYADMVGQIEPGDEQAHLVIEGPDCNWVCTVRRVPFVEETAKKEEKVHEPA